MRAPAREDIASANGCFGTPSTLRLLPADLKLAAPLSLVRLLPRLSAAGVLAVALILFPSGAVLACTDFARAPDSRWRTQSTDGVDWLITPCGDRFFSIGVNTVDGGVGAPGGGRGYHWRTLAPSLDTWAQRARARLLGWGFNTAGAWSLGPRRLDMPSTIELSLGLAVGFAWNDPFHPDLPGRVRAVAKRLIAPYKGDPRRIGYFSDNEIGWWNGALFTVYTRYGPANHTKQRLVRMLRERYHDDWTAFERDFVPPANVRGFDDLLRETRTPTRVRPGGQGFGAVRSWTRGFAENYYRIMSEAIRAADPEALNLGDRLPIYYDPDAVRAMAPFVDVIAMNYNIDGADGWIARYYFEGLRQLAPRPVLVTEWFFAAHENRTGNLNRTGPPKTRRMDRELSSNINRTGHLMTVATQEARAAGAAAATQALAREPNVVGLHWFQLYDHPKGGRRDGEDYNFGLLDVRDRPYEELVEALRRVNAGLPALHAEHRARDRTAVIPYAAIATGDGALTDWPKEAALIDLRPAPGEAVFGDVYLSWDRAGLNIGVIAMDYYDPEVMAVTGALPLEEAFRLDLGLQHGNQIYRWQLHVTPEPAGPGTLRPTFHVHACRVNGATCPWRFIQANYFGVAMDQPRVIFEARIPWNELGGRPMAGRDAGLAVALRSFYRSRWMSLTGQPPDDMLQHPANWPRVLLSGHPDTARPEQHRLPSIIP